MDHLNYHHLRYFHAIVEAGTLTAAAERLHVSQSSLSIQLKQLEARLGCALFDRQHKTLRLTEEGRMAFDYADTIFRTGDELMATLQNRGVRYAKTFRVGATATLSRNFQLTFLGSLLRDDAVEVVIHTASMGELIAHLKAHTLDVVLSNRPVPEDGNTPLRSHRVAEQPVSLVAGHRVMLPDKFSFPAGLADLPLILPTRESAIRTQFDRMAERSGLAPLIAAEADDMAMLRLLARGMDAIALLPPVVVKDELESGELRDLFRIPGLSESFYAISAPRRYPSPYLEQVMRQPGLI